MTVPEDEDATRHDGDTITWPEVVAMIVGVVVGVGLLALLIWAGSG